MSTMEGVVGARNVIEVSGTLLETGEVADLIGDAFRRSAQADANRIRIRVDDGAVVLEGEVTSWAEHDAAIAAAYAAPGVRAVHDRLLVTG